jgi:hypothetical protein
MPYAQLLAPMRHDEVLTVRPELVEGLRESTQGFDRLSPNGFQTSSCRINRLMGTPLKQMWLCHFA